MKVKIEIDNNLFEDEVVIKCNEVTNDINAISDYAKSIGNSIKVYKDEEVFKVLISKVLYFDSVDNNTFVYLENDTYECEYKLYELEEMCSKSFLRISKSCILNLDMLVSVKRMKSAKLVVKLVNGEELIINRSYVGRFKERFGV